MTRKKKSGTITRGLTSPKRTSELRGEVSEGGSKRH